jgi:hypothetical protein
MVWNAANSHISFFAICSMDLNSVNTVWLFEQCVFSSYQYHSWYFQLYYFIIFYLSLFSYLSNNGTSFSWLVFHCRFYYLNLIICIVCYMVCRTLNNVCIYCISICLLPFSYRTFRFFFFSDIYFFFPYLPCN